MQEKSRRGRVRHALRFYTLWADCCQSILYWQCPLSSGKLPMTEHCCGPALARNKYVAAQMTYESKLAARLVASELRRLANGCLDVLPKLVEVLENYVAERGMLLRIQDVIARQAVEGYELLRSSHL